MNGVSGRGLCWFVVRDETLWWSTTTTSVAFVKTRRRVHLGFRRLWIGERESTRESTACLPYGTSAPVLSGEPISCWTVVNFENLLQNNFAAKPKYYFVSPGLSLSACF